MKGKWWASPLGIILLMALCSGGDDDDELRRFCYDFNNGERRCFAEPLPQDKYCYIASETAVQCYDQPQATQ